MLICRKKLLISKSGFNSKEKKMGITKDLEVQTLKNNYLLRKYRKFKLEVYEQGTTNNNPKKDRTPLQRDNGNGR